ncbi:MAG: hypothetical protein GX807_00965 [Erysipelotrichia bacterium]|nr:hypothetical protein [Erysipelotrichia bacterium]
MKKKIIYYRDELNDDFASAKVEAKHLPDNFKYIRKNVFYRIGSFFAYFVFAKPLIWMIMKIYYLGNIENRKVIKKAKGTGYFIYGNHTGSMSDAFQPNLLKAFKKNYVVVGREALSIKGIRTFITMLGAIPLGETFAEKVDFITCLKTRINKKSSVMIYPEKHIWPYYTKIRPFENESFRFPISLNVPSFALTTTYHKRRGIFALSKRPKIIAYLDGPFYPDQNLKPQLAKQKLRDEIYQAMIERSTSIKQYEYIQYIKEKTDSQI